MFKIVLASFIALIPHSPSVALGNETSPRNWDEVCAAVEPNVMEGDLIFLDIPVFLFRQVALATQSWTSHVGIVFKDSDGSWFVAEATIPFSKETPLCDYLRKSSRYKFEIKRLARRLEGAELEKMRTSAFSMLGKTYGLGFNFDSGRTFCSKFAYLIYKSIGIEVGKVQTLRELIEENPQSSTTFWKFWYLWRIPLERRTVTPASQLNDSKLITVVKGD
ncbi:MAG: hypothetical protein J0L82_16050 [Deltaproteobacteria bacterium]|nr:hypothetical protein [Deltaproteobacteria bacterium]